MLGLCDTARVLALENSLNSCRQFHIDFTHDFLVFNYVYADAWINKSQHRIIYVDNVIEANLKACLAGDEAAGQAYNIAYGGREYLIDI